MLDAAVKALSQILSPPMRTILWRSIGLALILITILAFGLQRLLSWFAEYGEGWAEAMLGPGFHTPLNVLAWIVSIAAGLGVVLGGIFLMPAITSLVASVFVDDVADLVEHEHYPAEQPGVALPLAGGSQGDAQVSFSHGVHCGSLHCGVRVDPDRQPRDAAVRHGLHG